MAAVAEYQYEEQQAEQQGEEMEVSVVSCLCAELDSLTLIEQIGRS
jgi:hypothetical protein